MIQQSICPILDTIQKRKEKILPILEKTGIFKVYLGMQISIQFFGGSDLKLIGFGTQIRFRLIIGTGSGTTCFGSGS